MDNRWAPDVTMTKIAALPFDYEYPRARLALVVINMQRDFVEPGGFGASLGNDVTRLQAIVPALKGLIAACRTAGVSVIHTRECHQPDMSDCPPAKRDRGEPSLRIGDPGPMGRVLIAREPGAEIIPDLAPLPDETVIDKPGKGAFYATGFSDTLAVLEATHLLMTGVTTEVCVQTTMREAKDRGFECLLVEDCTESYFPQFKAATLEMVRAQGGNVGWTATASQIIESLETSA